MGRCNTSVANLRYLFQAKIINVGTGLVIEEAHARPDAPADNVIPGWKKWAMSDARHKDVIYALGRHRQWEDLFFYFAGLGRVFGPKVNCCSSYTY